MENFSEVFFWVAWAFIICSIEVFHAFMRSGAPLQTFSVSSKLINQDFSDGRQSEFQTFLNSLLFLHVSMHNPYPSSIVLDYSLIAPQKVSSLSFCSSAPNICSMDRRTGSGYMAVSSKMIATGTKISKEAVNSDEWTWIFLNRKSQKHVKVL